MGYPPVSTICASAPRSVRYWTARSAMRRISPAREGSMLIDRTPPICPNMSSNRDRAPFTYVWSCCLFTMFDVLPGQWKRIIAIEHWKRKPNGRPSTARMIEWPHRPSRIVPRMFRTSIHLTGLMLTLVGAATPTLLWAEEPIGIQQILEEPQVYHLRHVTLHGTVRDVQPL